MRTLILATIAVCAGAGTPAFAGSCAPIDNSARVLQSANPNDLAPEWTGEAYIGTAWSVSVDRRETSDAGLEYYYGTLYSPRGGDQGKVYILAREWDCPPVE